MTTVGSNIKEKRKSLNITQEELAEKLSVTRQAVSNWENGKTEPDIETLANIADIFGTSTDILINKNSAEKERNIKINPRLLLSAILLTLFLVFLFTIISFQPIIATGVTHVINKPLFLTQLFKPFCCITGIYGILLFISSYKNIFIKNSKVKKALLIIGSIGLGTFIITSIFFIAYTTISDNLFYSYPYLFYLRSPKFIQIIFQIFEFLSENILFSVLTPILLFLGINKDSKIYYNSNIRTIINCSLLIFSVASLLSFEIISPILKAYVSYFYDYRFYYLIVGFWKPAAIVLGTLGTLDLILKHLMLNIKSGITRKVIFIISIILLSVIFISNFIAFIFIYVSENVDGISSYYIEPAFFMMQHQILYIIPAILLSLGLTKKKT